MKKAVFTLLSIAFASTAAFGQLTFESDTLEFKERAVAGKVEAGFAFKNESDSEVTIASVRTSCGCTVATLPKKTYAPEETGKIEVTFKFGKRKGRQRKNIVVRYAGGELADQKLTLDVHIVETVEIKPKLVFWRRRTEPETRTFQVKIEPGTGIRISNVKSSSPGFSVGVKEDGEDRYLISITPESTAERQHSVITLEAESDEWSEPRNFLAYARVL